MRRLISNLFTLAAAVAALGLIAFIWAQAAFTGPGPAETERTVVVERGDGLSAIAARLENTGSISRAELFMAAARAMGVEADLKAGEYVVAPRMSMAEILNAMTEGRALQHRVTVAEGLTSAQVVAMLREDARLVGEIGAVPPEGSLAPDTYFLTRGERRQAVIDRMRRAQEARLAAAWEAREDGLPISTPDEALILASIIEKETAVPDERGLVASVFVNRLRQGMRLQTDPTVIYGVTGGSGPLGRPITRSDLNTPTPYNTYIIEGLPPTPIANPGAASINAALNPDESEYLFFVADGTGGHAFSRTYQEHQQAVARWREIERERRAAGSDG